MTDLRLVDLDADDLSWGQHAIAGAEVPAGIVMLRMDAERGVRTCLVEFPDGWTRPGTGNQPAGEEMVLLHGGLTMSGLTCTPQTLLVVEPRATRAATSTLPGTRAVVWFSGPGGGWADGEAGAGAGSARLVPIGDEVTGELRAPVEELAGSVHRYREVGGLSFETEVEVLWPQTRQWAFVPAGQSVPEVAGPALVHTY